MSKRGSWRPGGCTFELWGVAPTEGPQTEGRRFAFGLGAPHRGPRPLGETGAMAVGRAPWHPRPIRSPGPAKRASGVGRVVFWEQFEVTYTCEREVPDA